MLTRRLTPLFVVCLSIVPIASHCQTAKRSAPKNVIAGTISAVDAASATITLAPRTGPPQQFRLTEKTRILLAKRAATLDALKTGQTAVVRFRKANVGPPTLYDVCDKASWEWLDRIRREVTRVTVRAVMDEELMAAEGADGAEIAYRITNKTQWAKAGKPAASADFRPGDAAYVMPRMLPSGAIMAAAISDTASDAAKLKERARTTVSGTVRSVDVAKHSFSILSAAGDDRRFTLYPDVIIRMASKTLPIGYLRPGLSVTVHLRRETEGDDVALRITVQSKKPGGQKSAPAPNGASRGKW